MFHYLLLVIIYLSFISLGLPDGVLGLAWPSMRASLGLPIDAVGAFTMIVTCCSAVSGFLSGRVLQRFGTGPVTFASALMTGLALLGMSFVPNFPVMLALALPLGLGAGSVDAGLNNFVAQHYSSRHMNWLHACWGVGATIGPSIMGMALAGSLGWSLGYRLISLGQLAIAGLLFLSLGLWKREGIVTPVDHEAGGTIRPDSPRWAPRLAASLFIFYAAVEFGTGLWVASLLIEGRQVDPGLAGLAVTLYYGSIMGGRFLVGFVSERLGNRRLIFGGMAVAIAGLALVIIPQPAFLALPGLVLIGFGLAPVFPALMHETPRRFAPDTARKVIGWQVACANIGGAIMPAAFGLLAARAGLESVFPVVAAFALALLLLSVRLNRVT
jgi:MFS family permease